MTSANTFRSLLEPPRGQSVRHFQDHRLALGLASSQGVEAKAVLAQVHLHTDQPMRPGFRHLPATAQPLHLPLLVDPRRPVPSQGRDMPSRALAQALHRGLLEPQPYLGLPPAVVALDGRLEPQLVGRDEHRHNLQAQAGPDDPPQRIGVAVRALEDHVVVELGVAGQADPPPMLDQRSHHQLRGHSSDDRPGNRQPAMHRHPVEDLDLGPVPDDQPLDNVEAVQLGAGVGQVGQIPAPGRWRAAEPAAAVQSPAALQDAVDGPHRGDVRDSLLDQRLVKRFRPERAQVAVLPELTTHPQDQVLDGGIGPPGVARGPGAVCPIDSIEAVPPGAFDPVHDGAGAHAEAAGDGTGRLPPTDGSNHLLTTFGDAVCLLMLVPSMGVVFRYLSPPLFGMYWHTSARNVMALVQLPVKRVSQSIRVRPLEEAREPASDVFSIRETLPVPSAAATGLATWRPEPSQAASPVLPRLPPASCPRPPPSRTPATSEHGPA